MSKVSWWKRICLVCVFCAVEAIASPAQTFTTLVNFNWANGASPYAGLVQGTNGNFYGTTSEGGAHGGGTVFEITAGGTLTTLYGFCSQTNCTDGSRPVGALVQATDGSFYGTTSFGGAYGAGTVFKITPGGTLTTLHSFAGTVVLGAGVGGGAGPGGLVQGTDGNFYGTTGGGAYGGGTVFEITAGGTLTTLYSFCLQTACADGSGPNGLVQATDGSFYGTTSGGGANGGGTVFEISAGGKLTTLYSFCFQTACADGSSPVGALVQATDGNFYGTTNGGGANGDGTVFKITPTGTLTTLHSFAPAVGEGALPEAGLAQATDGNFYGTTRDGGVAGAGTIFEITAGGALTTLYSICSGPASACNPNSLSPTAGLLQATDGNFYGTTAGPYGTVFSLSVGLGPFVETEPTSGALGTAVNILGSNLTGATSVTFNGTAAAFTVVSSSEIETTVPAGATTGTVQVTTPSGTLNSNVAFRVTADTPTFNPPAGTYSAAQSVTLTDTTTGAVIYYTTDGSTPTTSSTMYTTAIEVSSTETIEAIAVAAGYSTSAVASGTYTLQLPAPTPAFTFTTLDVAGGGKGMLQGTVPLSINAAGDVTGIYLDATNFPVAHGFARAANGTTTAFDAPGAGTTSTQGTIPVSINTAGQIAGMYRDANNVSHGFVRATNGSITEFDVTGAGTGWFSGTFPLSIDEAGDISGLYKGSSSVRHGFVRAANGTITTFDVSAAGTGWKQGTYPLSINMAGDITGFHVGAKGGFHGFVRAPNGTISIFDVPGAGTGAGCVQVSCFVGTVPTSVDAAGDITGIYTDAGGGRHGFVRAANGTTTSFDAPGAATRGETIPVSINAAQDITGFYADASGVFHGFVRAANGTITAFDPPGVGLFGTFPASINAVGDITGTYTDANGVLHGFVLTPTAQAQIANLQNTVKALVSARILSPSLGQYLLAPLNAALAALDPSHTAAAIQDLREFVTRVQLLVIFRQLKPAEGQSLVDAANSLVTALRG